MASTVEITECCQPGIYKHPEWGKCSLCYKKENPEEFKNNSNIDLKFLEDIEEEDKVFPNIDIDDWRK